MIDHKLAIIHAEKKLGRTRARLTTLMVITSNDRIKLDPTYLSDICKYCNTNPSTNIKIGRSVVNCSEVLKGNAGFPCAQNTSRAVSPLHIHTP